MFVYESTAFLVRWGIAFLKCCIGPDQNQGE